MTKRKWLFTSILLVLALVAGTIVAFAADDNPIVNAGQIHKGDYITGGYSVTNDGTITGDLILGSQTLTSRGVVEGDILGYSMDVNISGDVGGNIRLGGYTINISSKVARNMMLFATTNMVINQQTVIEKNAYLVGSSIKSLAHVKGDTNVFGNYVTLGGTYDGDVTIHDMREGATFTLVPGTVISGKLTYKGISEPTIPQGVSIKSFEYVKLEPASAQKVKVFDIMSVVRKLLTLLAYYLFALLLYKLFPRFFVRTGDFISAKPASAVGIGVAALGTLVGGLLLLAIIFLLTLFVFDMSIFAFSGVAVTFFIGVTIAFADLPVALWLGNLITGRKGSVPGRLAAGLALIGAVHITMDILTKIPVIGSSVGVLQFLINAAIWFLGTGAILRVVFDMLKSANQQAEIEETDMESL